MIIVMTAMTSQRWIIWPILVHCEHVAQSIWTRIYWNFGWIKLISLCETLGSIEVCHRSVEMNSNLKLCQAICRDHRQKWWMQVDFVFSHSNHNRSPASQSISLPPSPNIIIHHHKKTNRYIAIKPEIEHVLFACVAWAFTCSGQWSQQVKTCGNEFANLR